MSFTIEMVARGGSTVMFVVSRRENNAPDCCDTTVEDASSIEDGEGVSVVLLSIARIVLITTDDKCPPDLLCV